MYLRRIGRRAAQCRMRAQLEHVAEAFEVDRARPCRSPSASSRSHRTAPRHPRRASAAPRAAPPPRPCSADRAPAHAFHVGLQVLHQRVLVRLRPMRASRSRRSPDRADRFTAEPRISSPAFSARIENGGFSIAAAIGLVLGDRLASAERRRRPTSPRSRPSSGPAGAASRRAGTRRPYSSASTVTVLPLDVGERIDLGLDDQPIEAVVAAEHHRDVDFGVFLHRERIVDRRSARSGSALPRARCAARPSSA